MIMFSLGSGLGPTFLTLGGGLVSHVWLSRYPWAVAHQASQSMGFPRQEYWGWLPCTSWRDLPDPGIEPTSSASAGGVFTTEPPGKASRPRSLVLFLRLWLCESGLIFTVSLSWSGVSCLPVCSDRFGEGNGTPLQYSCLENPMDGGAWWAAVHGVSKSQAWLSDFIFTFHFYALEKEMATHSSVLAWRIPGTAEPGGLPSTRSHRVGRDWSDLAVAVVIG